MKLAQTTETIRTLRPSASLLRVIIAYLVALSAGFSADLVELTRVGEWKRVPPAQGGASSARRVQVVDGVALLADASYGLEIIRTSDPSRPEWIGGYDTGLGWDLEVRGELVYVSDLTAGLAILNISDPSKPQRMEGYRGSALSIAFQGSLAYSRVWDGRFACSGCI